MSVLEAAKKIPYTVFTVANYTFGFPTTADVQLHFYERMTRNSQRNSWIKGGLLLEEEYIPVVDFKKVLGSPTPPTGILPRILVIDTITQPVKLTVGLLIERFIVNVYLSADQIQESTSEIIPAIIGMVELEHVGVMFLLNRARLFSLGEIRELLQYKNQAQAS